jgi:succinylglutamate desuccinylase
MDEITKDLLTAFEQRALDNPGPVPYSVSFGSGLHDRSLFICSALHGDEVGSIPAILRIIDDIKNKNIEFGGIITLALGNIEAIKNNKRFVTEDMNRIFNKSSTDTVDAERVQEIKKLITSHSIFIDLHQTIGPTKSPFYVIRGAEENMQLATIIAAAPLAMLVEVEANDKARMTSTAFAATQNITSFTLELSQKGYSVKAEELAYSAISKIIHTVNTHAISTWKHLASQKKPLEVITIEYTHEFTDPAMRLYPGLINGEFYKKDFELGEYKGQKILAPFDGYIFFPKYPPRDKDQNALSPLPSHLFEFGKVVNS